MDDKLFVASVEKTFLVLEAYNTGKKYLSNEEITKITGLNKSAVQRFTHSLHTLGYLSKQTQTKRYCLAPKSTNICYNYITSNPLIDILTPRLVDLRNTFDVTLNVSILDGSDVVFILQAAAYQELFARTIVGKRVPAWCSAGGRAMLSKFPESEYKKIITESKRIEFTKHTKTDPETIIEIIKTCQTNGYVINNQEYIIGEIVLSAPITNLLGEPIAAVHVSVSTRIWDEERLIKEISNEILNLVQSIHIP